MHGQKVDVLERIFGKVMISSDLPVIKGYFANLISINSKNLFLGIFGVFSVNIESIEGYSEFCKNISTSVKLKNKDFFTVCS